MATQLFEGKEHASCYQKYRFSPPQELQDVIFDYLRERLNKPYELAVDVGCGTGQSTKMLASHFKKVLGTDISEAQIEEANKALKLPNTTFRALPAEEVPVDDASVDLLTACAAVHWFDIGKFLKEVDRILKPRGCLAFYSYLPHMEVHYKDRSEQMTKVFTEVEDLLDKYQHEKVCHVKTGYKEIFETIPYTDKLRRDDITVKAKMPLADLIGLIQTFSMFQTYCRLEPEKSKDYIKTLVQRITEAPDTSNDLYKRRLTDPIDYNGVCWFSVGEPGMLPGINTAAIYDGFLAESASETSIAASDKEVTTSITNHMTTGVTDLNLH